MRMSRCGRCVVGASSVLCASVSCVCVLRIIDDWGKSKIRQRLCSGHFPSPSSFPQTSPDSMALFLATLALSLSPAARPVDHPCGTTRATAPQLVGATSPQPTSLIARKWSAYLMLLEQKPMATKMATSAVLGCSALAPPRCSTITLQLLTTFLPLRKHGLALRLTDPRAV